MYSISTPFSASAPTYQPQTDRLGLFHRGVGIALLGMLMVFVSVWVSSIDPKFSACLAAFCFFMSGKRLLNPVYLPLIAIIAYNALLSVIIPAPKPDMGVILQSPLFVLDCVLLSALVLGGQSVGRQYTLLLGMLIISVIGAVGDVTGHDMTALLPFPMPDDDFSNILLLQQSGDVLRIRGFFTEAGVLAAVSIGVATMVSIGALVLIQLRASVRLAWVGLITAIVTGVAILCITVTKSGFVMIGAGASGFIAALFCSRIVRWRVIAMVLLAISVVGSAVFLEAGPPTLTAYLKGEFNAAVNPYELTSPGMAEGHYGTITRYKCWALAFQSVRRFPLGVGHYGLGSVIGDNGNAGLNREMRYFFARDIFGLKNALANLLSETGIVGTGLLVYWLWAAFIQPIRHYRADGSVRGTLVAGVYGASAASCLMFLFSCESYPSLAFVIILKCHADAIAQACVPEPEPPGEEMELIA